MSQPYPSFHALPSERSRARTARVRGGSRGAAIIVALVMVLTACTLPGGIEITSGSDRSGPGQFPQAQPGATPGVELGRPAPAPTLPPVAEQVPDPTGNRTAIDAHIRSLAYDPQATLQVQPTGAGDSARTITGQTPSEQRDGNIVVTCTSTDYNLASNFDQIAILRPTNGIVWPGALVRANQALLDGVPEPLALPRAPITASIDLPGIGEAGRFTVDAPSNSTTQVAIDQALDWWNRNAYINGYVNAANSSYQYRTAYSSQQAALDVGVSLQWATGDFAGRFSVDTSSQTRTTVATFKQAFYTVAVDTPPSPGAVFDPVAADQVIAQTSSADAPAYVSSVTYGRILMVRMETSRNVTAAEAEAALNYAALVRASGTVDAEYEQILEESSIEVVTLGGNAAVSSQLIDPTTLNQVITGNNALYTVDNPGVPISYTVRHLHDNSLAKLGYTTDYTAEECTSEQVGDTIRVTLIRFQALADCDGIEGAGDFSFRARVLDANGNELPNTRTIYDGQLNDGEFANTVHEATFDMDWQPGAQFTVEFLASEVDQDIFGNVWNDDRLDRRVANRTHQFVTATNSWSNLDYSSTGLGGAYPQAIQLTSGSGDCRTELHYVVDFL